MTDNTQPLALMLADRLHHEQPTVLRIDAEHAGEERRRLHARIAELEAQLEAIGAGGVEPLRRRECLHKIAEPAPAPAAVARTAKTPSIFALQTEPKEGESQWGGIYSNRANAEHDAEVMRNATGREWHVVKLVEASSATVPSTTTEAAAHEWKVSHAFGGEICANCGSVKGTRRGNAPCGEAAAPATQAAPQPAPIFGDEDHVLVPRGLLGAACSAIDKKRDGVKTLAELRRYTTGDLSKAAPQQDDQKPYAYAVYFPDQPTVELVHDLDELTDDLTNREHQITRLYAAPQAAPAAQGDAEDAARYRCIRRGQHWSVIDGIGNELRAEALDTAIDAARKQGDTP